MTPRSSWYLDTNGEREWLPICSGDYRPSSTWFGSCLHDPVGPICRRHKKFFRDRKVNR